MKSFNFSASTLLLVTLLVGCSHTAVINENYTQSDPAFQRTYSSPTKKCAKASADALKDMKIGIESQSEATLTTERYDAYKFTTTTGSVSAAGSIKANTELNSQQVKLYLKISPEAGGCKVQISKVRAWNNGQEFETLNVDFTKQMAVAPFFNELNNRL